VALLVTMGRARLNIIAALIVLILQPAPLARLLVVLAVVAPVQKKKSFRFYANVRAPIYFPTPSHHQSLQGALRAIELIG